MIIRSEPEMITLGEQIAEGLVPPVTIELLGDVGAGKTTLTKGIARALGIAEPITSPSFTISKSYQSKTKPVRLNHFDFYRLTDPGIMSEDLDESIHDPHTVTIVEWADTVAEVLPDQHIIVNIKLLDDGNRAVEITK